MKRWCEKFVDWCDDKDSQNVPDIPVYPVDIRNEKGTETFVFGKEIYKHVPGDVDSFRRELKDQLVCKISGVDGSIVPGYHFNKEWATVCPVNAECAMWVGVKLVDLVQIN
jgi:hypothetical protein